MSQTGIGELEGTGIFFGCGHSFVQVTKYTLASSLRDAVRSRPQCPFCHVHKCLACSDYFSGQSCETCDKFYTFEAMANEAISLGLHKLCFRGGLVLIPKLSNESAEDVESDTILGAVGVVKFEETVANGKICMSEEFELQISEIERLKLPSLLYQRPLKMKMKIGQLAYFKL